MRGGIEPVRRRSVVTPVGLPLELAVHAPFVYLAHKTPNGGPQRHGADGGGICLAVVAAMGRRSTPWRIHSGIETLQQTNIKIKLTRYHHPGTVEQAFDVRH